MLPARRCGKVGNEDPAGAPAEASGVAASDIAATLAIVQVRTCVRIQDMNRNLGGAGVDRGGGSRKSRTAYLEFNAIRPFRGSVVQAPGRPGGWRPRVGRAACRLCDGLGRL